MRTVNVSKRIGMWLFVDLSMAMNSFIRRVFIEISEFTFETTYFEVVTVCRHLFERGHYRTHVMRSTKHITHASELRAALGNGHKYAGK